MNYSMFLVSFVVIFLLTFINPLHSQEEQIQFQEEEYQPDTAKASEEPVPERLKYYRERYEETFNEPFDVVWRSIKKSLEDISCMISYEKYQQDQNGLFSGTLKSDFCVFSFGRDTTFKVLKRYSLEMPLIRGGIWENGRIQYNFKVKENEDGTVFLSFRAQLSGFEDFVTHQVHFWKSNGYLETKMLERIRNNLALVKEKE